MIKDKKTIVLIVLAIGAVVSLIYGITAPAKSKHNASVKTEANVTKKTKNPSATQGPSQKEAPEKVSESSQRLSKETDYKDWGRNPFTPEKTSIREVNLSGIVWDEVNPKAIVNGETVGIGDTIAGYKIINITSDAVVLDNGTDKITRRLDE